MTKISDIINGEQKLKGKAIKSTAAKEQRKIKVQEFVEKYGRGDQGLTEAQKKARIEKFIGKATEINKVAGLGANEASGVILNNKLNFKKTNIDEENKEAHDSIAEEVIKNLGKYPKDMRAGKNKDGSDQDLRIVYANVKDNGEMEIHHIHKDGNETNPLIRQMSGLIIMDDYTAAINEAKQYKKGELMEISDRTMAIHESEGVLDIFLEDDEIDTDEDKEYQI